MGVPIFVVDAFTSEAFRGNPAAVCLLDEAANPAWMQSVAAEMNLSETAFVHPRGDGDGFDLRWFTPTTEVDLCGHATLAATHVLWETGRLGPGGRTRFETRSGSLSGSTTGDGVDIDLPADPPSAAEAPPGLLDALGVVPVAISRANTGWIVELVNEAAIRAVRPDFGRLAPFVGAVVTAGADDPRFDFVSRYFVPGAGIDEDPVTGAAHCALACYWSPRIGRDELLAYQASTRGGVVGVRLDGDRVLLHGDAVTVLRGALTGER